MEYNELLLKLKLDEESQLTANTCHIFKNDKLLLLTKPKVAHSWCRDNFLNQDSKNKNQIHSSFNIDFINLNLKKISIESEDDLENYEKYFDDISETWNAFLEKNEKRDFIILYRNPLENWLSAFVQDYIEPLVPKQEINSPYFLKFIKEIPRVSHGTLDDFITDCSRADNFKNTFTEKYPIIMHHIYKLHLDIHIEKGEYTWGHYYPWIAFVYKIVNTNLIDSSKIKIIDTYDSPLEEQLKPYLLNSSMTPKGYKKHNHSFDILYTIINQSNYKIKILEYLKDEINMYYDLKENYKNFHINSGG